MKTYTRSHTHHYYIFQGDINTFISELEQLINHLTSIRLSNYSRWQDILNELKQLSGDKYTKINDVINKYGYIILHKDGNTLYRSEDNYQKIYKEYLTVRNNCIINYFEETIKNYEESINRE